MTRTSPILLALVIFTGCNSSVTPSEELAPVLGDGDFEYVNTSDPLSPDEERAAFHLPPGFEAQLFAAEPDIGKPMNIAFDAKGRLWVTQSTAYPFPADEDAGSDRLTILEDTDGDGRADVFTDFADDLNIPIGVTPVSDGAIVYSIPNLYHLTDTDGDDRSDKREVLAGPFGYLDTHGMVNNLMRGLDGWIHAGHGFRNTSTITGTDGTSLTMVSGNTFRFQSDGSGLQTTTTGRVNPFGFAYDERGYLYGVDCHTTPIYQLIRGGDYPHFGKQPVGIGFPPVMMHHTHGPTAIAGFVFYTSDHFPPDYQENFYSGNPVSGRINRNKITYNGSTPEGIQQPDFLISDDPWFRPVDVKMGPDGALYVADFYNRIIGHYEVPLDHPGRDRERGRIWRIVYTGADHQHIPDDAETDWMEVDLTTLISGLGHRDLRVRMLVADEIVDRFGAASKDPIQALMRQPSSSPHQQAHGLWVLHRLNALDDALLDEKLASDEQLVHLHALRILFERTAITAGQRAHVVATLNSADPHLQRAAAEVLGRFPVASSLKPLLAVHPAISDTDTHLAYTTRQVLRDHLRNDDVRREVVAGFWSEADSRALADVMIGVDVPEAASFLLTHVQTHRESSETMVKYVGHIARYLPESSGDELVTFVQTSLQDDLDFQLNLFRAIKEGVTQRGSALSPMTQSWGVALATHFLGNLPEENASWKNTPIEGMNNPKNPWGVVDTPALGEFAATRMLSSTFGGDPLTGILTSPRFELPATFSFYMIGRDGPTTTADAAPRNRARLRLAESGEIVAEATLGEQLLNFVEWDADEHEGAMAYFDLIDAAADNSSAFIAAGEFSHLEMPEKGPAQLAEQYQFAAQLAGEFGLAALVPDLMAHLSAKWTDFEARAAAAEALIRLDVKAAMPLLTERLQDGEESTPFKSRLAAVLGGVNNLDAQLVAVNAMANAPLQLQLAAAQALAGTPTGKTRLIEAAEAGLISPRLLLDPRVQNAIMTDLPANSRRQYDQLTADIEPIDQERQRQIEARVASFRPEEASSSTGASVFSQYCMTCHAVDGQGGQVGPQLDGVGRRGTLSLTEKILAPNRNVTPGFQSYTLKLRDGSQKTGLLRREEGETQVYADLQGEEFIVPSRDIVEQTSVPFSLMPGTFNETISEADYHDLLAYLLTLR